MANGGSLKSGCGPDGPTRIGPGYTGSQGYLMLAFGIALGPTFMIFFGIFRKFSSLIENFEGLNNWVTPTSVNPNLWWSFVIGFVGSTVLSGIYNILVIHRLNLLGLKSIWIK